MVCVRPAHVATVAAVLAATEACTIFMVGKGATTFGANIVTHTDDAGDDASDVRLVRVPAMDHAPGTKRPIYQWANGYPRIVSLARGPEYMPKEGQELTKPIGYIDQVPHTYALWENDYGTINEHNLAMGESTLNSKLVGFPVGPSLNYTGKCLWGIDSLTRIALERCKTARCAIQLMGDLGVKDGFYSDDSNTYEDPDYDDSAEGLGICDMEECWVFNILTGLNHSSAVWAAQRVPDDHVVAIPNSITIRHMDLDDHENFMYSDNVQSVALTLGWWDGKEEWDFFKAYGFDYSDTWDETVDTLYSGRRAWGFYNLMAPSLKLDGTLGMAPKVPTYNFSYKPDEPVDMAKIKRALRDYYQGTKWDMSKGVGAGPFSSPIRFDTDDYGLHGSWERPTAIFRGVFSHIITLNQNLPYPLDGTMWYGQHQPLDTIYVPIFGAQNEIPVSYVTGINSKFNRESAWWAFDFLGNWIQLKWSFMIKEVNAAQEQWEKAGELLITQLAAQITGSGLSREAALKVATQAQNEHATAVVDAAWALGEHLISKYSDGYITTGEKDGQQVDGSYPKEWLASQADFMKYPNGPPPAEVRNMTATAAQPEAISAFKRVTAWASKQTEVPSEVLEDLELVKAALGL
jgi:dipeptidase